MRPFVKILWPLAQILGTAIINDHDDDDDGYMIMMTNRRSFYRATLF